MLGGRSGEPSRWPARRRRRDGVRRRDAAADAAPRRPRRAGRADRARSPATRCRSSTRRSSRSTARCAARSGCSTCRTWARSRSAATRRSRSCATRSCQRSRARSTVGQAQYSMACQADGGIIDDLICYRLDDDRFWVVCNASNRAAVVEQLTALLSRRATSAPRSRTGASAPRSWRRRVRGAAALLAELTDVDLSTDRQLPLRAGHGGRHRLPRGADRVHRRGRLRAVLRRPPHARRSGTRCSKRRERTAARPCGLGARDTLRLEAGMPLYGNELSPRDEPVRGEPRPGRQARQGRVRRPRGAPGGPAGGSRAQAHRPPDAWTTRSRAPGYAVHAGGEAVGTRHERHALADARHEDRHGPRAGRRWPASATPSRSIVRDRPYRAEQVKLPFYRRPRELG